MDVGLLASGWEFVVVVREVAEWTGAVLVSSGSGEWRACCVCEISRSGLVAVLGLEPNHEPFSHWGPAGASNLTSTSDAPAPRFDGSGSSKTRMRMEPT
jgi:hypothetical protein